MIEGWLEDIESEVRACIGTRRSISVAELAAALRVSEHCAASYVALLAAADRLRIEHVSLPPGACPVFEASRPAA